MINLKTILSQSVPIKKLTTKEVFKSSLVAIGLVYFIFVFLEPFDFNVGNSNKYIVFSWFALAYFLTLFIIVKWGFPLINKIANVKVYYFYHFIIGYLFIVTTIAFVHHALQNYLNELPIINITSFTNTLSHAILIGLIPSVLISLVSYNQALKKQINTSVKDLTKSLKKVNQKGMITIKAVNNKDYYRFEAATIIYIKSDDNYVDVFYQQDKTATIEHQLIRTTLKNIEHTLSYPFLRVHRSYLINLNHAYKISGNSQGMQLFIKSSSTPIPVSRSYIEHLKNALKSD